MRFRFGEFEVDEDRFELRQRGEPVTIEPKPLRVLLYLLERHPSAPERQELLDALWPDAVVGEAVLSRAVRAARVALGEDARDGKIIRTVRGRGFRIGVDVERLGSTGSATGAEAPSDGTAERLDFVGRGEELARTGASLEAALAGAPRVVLLLGEPGIGKTRLAQEVAATASTRGAEVLWSRAHEGAPAFWPWLQLLRAHAEHVDLDSLRRDLGRGAADVAALAPDLLPLDGPSHAAALEPQEARFRLFESIAGLLRAAARRAPLVLVLDDLHWADEASVLLLEFVLAEVTDAPLLVLATLRDTEGASPARDRLLASAARAGHSELVPLGGLDRAELDELARITLDEEAAPDLLDALQSRSAGNPFFAREILALAASGRGAADPTAGLPPGAEHVVRARLAQLPEATHGLLRVAAIAGDPFRLAMVARAAGERPADALSALEPAERARLVETTEASGSFRFSHALVREALQAELASGARAAIHYAVAEALASQPKPDLSELAAHHLAALPGGDPEAALDVVVRAAAQARERLAFEEAIRFAEAGLRVLDEGTASDRGRRCLLLEHLADAQFRAGEREASVETLRRLVDEARATDDVAALGRAAATLALNQFFTAGVHGELAPIVEEALRRQPEGDSTLRVHLQAGLARQLTWTGDSDRQQGLLAEAVAMARRLDEPATLLEALCTEAAYLDPLDDARRRAIQSEVQTVAGAGGLPSYQADACWFRLQHAIELAEADAIERELETLAVLAEDLDHPHFAAFVELARALRALWRGDLEDAERLVAQAYTAGSRSESAFADQARGAQTMQLMRYRGQDAVLEPAIRAATLRLPMVSSYRCALALSVARLGRLEEAAELLTALTAGDAPGLGERDPNLPLNLALLSEVAVAVGDPEAGIRIEAVLSPRRGRYLYVPNLLTLGAASHYLGLLENLRGESEAAVASYGDALETEERMQARPRIAATRLATAEALEQAGGEASAVASNRAEADRIGRELGIEAWLYGIEPD